MSLRDFRVVLFCFSQLEMYRSSVNLDFFVVVVLFYFMFFLALRFQTWFSNLEAVQAKEGMRVLQAL